MSNRGKALLSWILLILSLAASITVIFVTLQERPQCNYYYTEGNGRKACVMYLD